MASTRVKLNHAGMRELLSGAGTRAILTAEAERILAAAKASAPVDSGEYRDGLHIVQETHGDRAVVRVVGGSDHDMIVEANTGNLAKSL